jgi:hypothetical protein
VTASTWVSVGQQGREFLFRQLLNPFAAEACPGIPRQDVLHTEDIRFPRI